MSRVPARLLAGVLLLSLIACAGEAVQSPAVTASPPTPPSAVRLARSVPEPGVALEQVDVVTPTGTFRFQAEIADDDGERQMGLMNRATMAEDRGMLFLFPGPPQPQSFWMRNTLIPLDILYLRPDGSILSIARQTTPLSEVGIPSNGAASAVLEINGGLSDRLGIAPGDRVRHRAFPGG